jgi:sigma-B regulation protein RsbU (phosphoserine phosphatase)
VTHLLLSLINNMAVVLVVAYLITRASWFEETLGGRVSPQARFKIGLIFGLLGTYGTFSGTTVMNAVANTRYIGPLIGGLLGGPVAGLCSGLIAGVHEQFFGNDVSKLPSFISTLVAGLAGGIFHYVTTRRTGKQLEVVGATLFAMLVQILHQSLILLMIRPFAMAWELVNAIGIPMFLTNGIGTGIFFYFINNMIKERATRQQRDQYLGQKLRIEGELSVARDIQMGMVPKMFPNTPEWPECSLFAHLRSAREVGGDFYDFYLDPEGKLIFVIGDVSDKGVPAALFMAETKTLLKGMCEPGQMPHELLGRVNRELEDGNALNMFVTLFCAKLDFATGELWFSNAGHNPPLLIRQGEIVEWLKLPPGLVLGAFPSSSFSTEKIVLAPGDTVFAYTDGVTEAMNLDGVMYSERRLVENLRSMAGGTPREMVDGLEASVKQFTLGAVQSDDVTLIAVKYSGQEC